MAQLPLSDKGRISNSILEFVLFHPQTDDVLKAYNQWAQTEAARDFPWGEGWMPSFCLTIFSTCMNVLTRENLEDIYYEEQKILIQSGF